MYRDAQPEYSLFDYDRIIRYMTIENRPFDLSKIYKPRRI